MGAIAYEIERPRRELDPDFAFRGRIYYPAILRGHMETLARFELAYQV